VAQDFSPEPPVHTEKTGAEVVERLEPTIGLEPMTCRLRIDDVSDKYLPYNHYFGSPTRRSYDSPRAVRSRSARGTAHRPRAPVHGTRAAGPGWTRERDLRRARDLCFAKSRPTDECLIFQQAGDTLRPMITTLLHPPLPVPLRQPPPARPREPCLRRSPCTSERWPGPNSAQRIGSSGPGCPGRGRDGESHSLSWRRIPSCGDTGAVSASTGPRVPAGPRGSSGANRPTVRSASPRGAARLRVPRSVRKRVDGPPHRAARSVGNSRRSRPEPARVVAKDILAGPACRARESGQPGNAPLG
jgi:hypothetical protein